ncbi:hypothetical protein PHMEG_0006545 [Phytophthora megakarya]|uniref:Uncharacterized protein n=1 Tax=Phytophthora megakarya TaxID=4795 RepID=A0A225WNW6_9STRA|nr:hypothetical protein PHMEG_0006545 [Phytophthora megakarya]
MSARSRKLAAKKKYIPIRSPLRCGCCGGKEDTEGKCGCTIQPRVNQRHAGDIYERQLKWKHANQVKHSQQKQLQETLAMTECTFRNPFYQKEWSTFDDNTIEASKEGNNDVNTAFFKRCMLWAEKRDRRVAREKKASQVRQIRECTFKPHITAQTPKYLNAKRKQSNQQDNATPSSSHLPSAEPFLDCSSSSSPEKPDLSTDELLTQLYSALDHQALAGNLSPEYNIIGSNDEGAHGFPKYTFTDFGEFAGR